MDHPHGTSLALALQRDGPCDEYLYPWNVVALPEATLLQPALHSTAAPTTGIVAFPLAHGLHFFPWNVLVRSMSSGNRPRQVPRRA